jgi:hypothetical protein
MSVSELTMSGGTVVLTMLLSMFVGLVSGLVVEIRVQRRFCWAYP